MILNREPVAILNAVRLLILCAVSFGLDFTEAQIVGVMAALEAVLTVITRQSVTPTGRSGGDRGAIDPGSAALGLIVGVFLGLWFCGFR